jgi:ABC-type oligopeptide transport system ATPase subunit
MNEEGLGIPAELLGPVTDICENIAENLNDKTFDEAISKIALICISIMNTIVTTHASRKILMQVGDRISVEQLLNLEEFRENIHLDVVHYLEAIPKMAKNREDFTSFVAVTTLK